MAPTEIENDGSESWVAAKLHQALVKPYDAKSIKYCILLLVVLLVLSISTLITLSHSPPLMDSIYM